jgi:hypothetical protein
VPNLKKIYRGILKLLPFKVSGHFTRVLMRIKIDKKHISKRLIFLKFFTQSIDIVEFSNEFTKKVGRGFSL